MKGKFRHFSQFKQPEWLSGLAFAVDNSEHMNEPRASLGDVIGLAQISFVNKKRYQLP